jgi:hypothetical protein
VGVEKLLPAKFAKMKSRQDAPQTIFSGRRDIFSIPPILAVWDEKRVFQHPRLLTTVTSDLTVNRPQSEAVLVSSCFLYSL